MSLPKQKYEQKVENIMNNTKMERKDAIMPKNLRDSREVEKEAKEKMLKSRKQKREAERKEKADHEAKHGPKVDYSMTLFVRNISYDVT
jgi:hypothetical protein